MIEAAFWQLAIPSSTSVYDLDARKLRPTAPWDPATLAARSKTDTDLPEDLLHYAIEVTGQEVYAEQLGGLIAARLIGAIDDYETRAVLSAAVADEARHSEVFARFVLETAGRLPPPDDLSEHLHRTLLDIDDVRGLLIVHTLLEGFALDSFTIFIRMFSGHTLERIYQGVRVDEARHVANGIRLVRRSLADLPGLERKEMLEHYRDQAAEAAGLDSTAWEIYGALASEPPSDVEAWFSQRTVCRCAAILESKIPIRKEVTRT